MKVSQKETAVPVPAATEDFTLLGLDVSTTTIGVSLFSSTGQLLELTHISPKVKPVPTEKIEELVKKAGLFQEFIKSKNYATMKIKHVLIEEPLLGSNNIYTVATLLRFNGMITKIVADEFGVYPEFLSTYEARKNGFPVLMQPNAKGKDVLFGAYSKDVDKKKVIWELVSAREPQISWLLDKKGALKKENFDMSDSYTVALAYARQKDIFS